MVQNSSKLKVKHHQHLAWSTRGVNAESHNSFDSLLSRQGTPEYLRFRCMKSYGRRSIQLLRGALVRAV